MQQFSSWCGCSDVGVRRGRSGPEQSVLSPNALFQDGSLADLKMIGTDLPVIYPEGMTLGDGTKLWPLAAPIFPRQHIRT